MMNILNAALNSTYKSYQPGLKTPENLNMNKQINFSANRKRVKVASVIGSAIGITAAVAGIYAMAKKRNPDTKLHNLTYEEKDVLLIGAGSVLGGLTGGLLSDENKNNIKPKLREASQQFFGSMMCPIGLLALANKGLEKLNYTPPKIPNNVKGAKALNVIIGALPKVAVTIGSIVAGMEIGNKIMNKVNNKIFKEEVKHDVEASDYLVHADDICLAANLLLKDTKSISKITSKALPATFILAGIKTGTQEA